MCLLKKVDEETKARSMYRWAANIEMLMLFFTGLVAFTAFLLIASVFHSLANSGQYCCFDCLKILGACLLAVLIGLGCVLVPIFIIQGAKNEEDLSIDKLRMLVFQLFAALSLFITASSFMFQLAVALLR